MKKSNHIFIVLLILFFFMITSFKLARPFDGHQDWDNVRAALSARNYMRYGFFAYDGLQMLNNLPLRDDETPNFYRSWPPTLSFLTTASVQLFGFHEMFIRLPNLFLTLLSIALIYHLAYLLYGRRVALMAVCFFTMCPFVLYFARINNNEPGGTTCMLLLLVLYIHWLQRAQPWHIPAMLVVAFLSLWYAHFMAFVLILIFIHSLLWGTRRQQVVTLLIGIAGLVGAITWLYHTTSWFSPEGIDQVLGRVSDRTQTSELTINGRGMTLPNYLFLLLIRLCYGFLPFLLILAGIGAKRLYSSFSPHQRQTSTLLWVMFGSAFLYNMVWFNTSFFHDFYLYAFISPLAIWAGYGLNSIWGRNRSWLPANRVQRLAGGLAFGQLLGAIIITVYLINLTNPTILPAAQAIKAHASPDDLIATNIANVGPAIAYYAGLDVLYTNYSEANLEDLLLNQEYDLFVLCVQEDITDEDLPDFAEVAPMTGDCYAVTAR